MKYSFQMLPIIALTTVFVPVRAGADEATATPRVIRVWQTEPGNYLQDDFTDASRAALPVVTSYRVGRGFLDDPGIQTAEPKAPLAQSAALK